MKKSLLVVSLLTAVLLTAVLLTAYAHEYILVASAYRLNRGDTLEVHLFVADGFNVELERNLQKGITKKFELITRTQREDLLTQTAEGTLPVLGKKVDFEGLGLVAMERDYARITLENKKFLAYLKEDHIENIDISKTARPQQRERYARYLKCLVQSGKVMPDTLHKARIGHRFEMVLLQNPYALAVGSTLRAQVFFDNKPLAGKVITIRNRTGGQAATRQLARTDTRGICRFILNRKGDWFLHATHMIACPQPAEADWESHWVSYSFGME
jgi:uncharacterized GH25 family protein